MINGLCVDSVLQKIIYCLAKKVTVLEESYKKKFKKKTELKDNSAHD